MKKKCTSAQCCDTRGGAVYGGLFGIVVAAMHHVHHAVTNVIPDNIPVHVLTEMAAGAFAGAILFTVASVLCNRLHGDA
jgi:hypothetical protein